MRGTDPSSPTSGLDIINDSHFLEYRYYTDKRSRQLIGRYLFLDSLVVCLISYYTYLGRGSLWQLIASVCVLLIYVYWRCSRIIYESILVIPPHGLQLETHRGPFGPLFVARRFIPSVYIQDIIINEALRRWNVRYYIAVIMDIPGENIELVVAFENTLPHFPVLLRVYRGVIQALYSK